MSLYRLKQIAKTAGPEDQAWLLAVINRYERGEDMNSAMEVSGTRALIRRNKCLLEVANILNPEKLLKPWPVAGEIEKHILRVETRGGKEHKEIDRLILEALGCGQMLRSQRRIYELLTD